MKKILPVLLILLLSTVAFAQNKGRVIGTISTDDGAVIAGVKVTIASDSLIARSLTTVSNDRGMFRFVLLPIGTYKVTFEKEGYSTVEQSGLELGFAATATLNRTMKLSDFEEIITITGEAPVVDKTSSAVSDKLDIEFLQNQPNQRNVWAMPNLSAGFTGNSAFGGVESAGQAYNTDGVNVSDPATGTVFSSINMEAVEQVDVAMFGSNAEYGAFTGASLNVVTRSGGNDFSGEVNYFAQRVDWVSDNSTEYDSIGAPTASDLDDPNFALGGPIMKDKIWFFGNYNWSKNSIQHSTLDGIVTEERTPIRSFAKVSARWDDRNITTGSWTYYKRDRSHRVAYGAWSTNHEDGLWEQVSESDTYLVQHSFIASDDIIIEGRFAGFIGGFDLVPRVPGPTIYNYDIAEYGNSLSRTDLYNRNRDNLLLTSNYFNDDLGGSHSFKVGYEYEDSYTARYYSHELRHYYRNGDWWRWYNYGTYEGGTIIKRHAGYLQDSWSVNDKLTINLGVRIDSSSLMADEERGGLANGTESFMTLNDPAYRLGFVYDLTGDGKTVVRGFVGRYYEGVLSGNTEPMITAVPPTIRYDWNGSEWAFYSSSGGSTPGAYEVDPDISNQYTEGIMIGLERELKENIAASAMFIWKKDFDQMGIVYPNDTWDQVNVTGEYYSGMIYDNSFSRNPEYYTNPKKGDNGVLEDLRRVYWGAIFELNKRMSDNWSLKASYTFSRSEGNVNNNSYGIVQGFSSFSDPNSFINGYGRLGRDAPHQLKMSGTYIAPFDIYLSPAVTYRSGYAYAVYEELGNDSAGINIYAPDGSDRYDNQFNIDIRAEKAFMIADRYRLGLIFDWFNVLNDDAVTGYSSLATNSSAFERPSSIVGARFYQIGVRLLF